MSTPESFPMVGLTDTVLASNDSALWILCLEKSIVFSIC